VATILILFLQNKLTKLANFVQFKRMLRPMFCLQDWGLRSLPPARLGRGCATYHPFLSTPLVTFLHVYGYQRALYQIKIFPGSARKQGQGH